MYLEHFQLQRSPFLEDADPAVFFTDAGRYEVYQALLKNIKQGKPLVSLIGDEGSGKTLLCKVFAVRLPAAYQIVFITNPLGSFEDLLRIICLDLGMTPAIGASSDELISKFKAYLARKRDQRQIILVVIDEAEKLFLATMERLVRLLSDIGEDKSLHILLSGRSFLAANIKQLLTYNIEIDLDKEYSLRSLNLVETGKYLNFRLQASGLAEEDHKKIFTDGAVKKIYETAQGNLKVTNMLAEEALQRSCSEKSFLVLLDHVELQSDSEKVRPSLFTGLLSNNAMWLGVGASLLIVVLVIVFSPGPNEKVPVAVIDSSPEDKVMESSLPVDKVAAEPVQSYSSPTTGDNPPDVKLDSVKDVEDEPGQSEDIYQLRSDAGKLWLKEKHDGEYTIQLMMLSSSTAEENLKQIIRTQEYNDISDQIYILSKSSDHLTLFVYYGMFSSMEAARQARNTMPSFLRKHHPYALAINDAIKKIVE
ncbi:MAG: AAA family ATPase [Desulfobulbaceae bacterium]|nr:AAA family ATPase [Desulfobulbaceae bacterium]